jgi:hypothetical protein
MTGMRRKLWACRSCGKLVLPDLNDHCPTLCAACYEEFLDAEYLMTTADLLSPDLTMRQALARSEARMRRVGMSDLAIRGWWEELEPLLLATEAKGGVYAGGIN